MAARSALPAVDALRHLPQTVIAIALHRASWKRRRRHFLDLRPCLAGAQSETESRYQNGRRSNGSPKTIFYRYFEGHPALAGL